MALDRYLQRKAEELLGKPVFGPKNLEFWLQEMFPHGIQEMQRQCEIEARPLLNELSVVLDIPKLTRPWDSNGFSAVFQDAENRLYQYGEESQVNDNEHPGKPYYTHYQEKFQQLKYLMKKWRTLHDRGSRLVDDMLPILQRWRDTGEVHPVADAELLRPAFVDLFETPWEDSITFMKHYAKTVSEKLQPDSPSAAYGVMSKFLTEVLTDLEFHQRDMHMDGHISRDIGYINRIKDVWKHSRGRQ